MYVYAWIDIYMYCANVKTHTHKHKHTHTHTQGQIWAKVHYYEDGNVHLNASRAYTSPLTWTDAASFASALARAVRCIVYCYY